MRPMQKWRICCVVLIGLLAAVSARAQETYTFAIVPQQPASKIATLWGPVLSYLQSRTGYHFSLVVKDSIPHFEDELAQGQYDFAYMNPYHYTVYHEKPGYLALVKARNREIRGIIVVAKRSPLHNLQDLNGKKAAFPSPAAFAASLLARGHLSQQGIKIMPHYVGSHDAAYLNVARGLYPAGGGIIRTLESMPAYTRDQLRVIWTSAPYTPHPIAVHPRVPKKVANAVRTSLVELADTQQGRKMLAKLPLQGWDSAKDADWNDIRALHINSLK